MKEVNFTVDAGIINRLGKELVGRVETAVSELVKNAYDADANQVKLNFINTDKLDGILIIEDDGTGMNENELINGFMRLSSSDKVHNPVSPIFKRVRAGKKGIGRFATQRLGKKLTIFTQKENSEKAIKIEIDWNKYQIDQELSSIYHTITEISKVKNQGTTLYIEGLNEVWTEAQIKRVYRYISELLQPDFLSERSKVVTLIGNKETLKIASQQEGAFKVAIVKTQNGDEITLADEDKMVFNHSVAVIEGYIDKSHVGYCSVISDKLNIEDIALPIENEEINDGKYNLLSDVHFKIYYFIYNRPEYYTIPKTEVKRIENLLKINAGVKLYRNGFRVLPYGEKFDDWLKIDAKGGQMKGLTSLPFRNNNFYGFVEVIDILGSVFEETASREGLRENEALLQLKDFVYKSLILGTNRISEGIAKVLSKKRANSEKSDKTPEQTLNDIERKVEQFIDEQKNESGTDENEKSKQIEKNEQFKKELKEDVLQIKNELEERIEKLGMYRVLASLGLTIEMFTHEVQTYNEVFNSLILDLENLELEDKGKEIIKEFKTRFNIFKSYTAYFNAAASKNESMLVEPINLRRQINAFIKTIEFDRIRAGINEISTEYYDLTDFYTCPMHPAEWQSILLNLYSNSKKAIKRQRQKNNGFGNVKIIIGYENNKIYIEFLDNGDGIAEENKERIFNAFFSTSTPASFDAEEHEEMSGIGLGLRIVADIVEAYKGDIYVGEPESIYKTCIRIDIPKATEKQLKEYGID